MKASIMQTETWLAVLLPLSSRDSTPERILQNVEVNIVQQCLARDPNRQDPPAWAAFVGLDHDDPLVQHMSALEHMFRAAGIHHEITIFYADELSEARRPVYEVRPSPDPLNSAGSCLEAGRLIFK